MKSNNNTYFEVIHKKVNSVFRFQSFDHGESFVQFGFFFYPLLFLLFLLNRLDGYTIQFFHLMS